MGKVIDLNQEHIKRPKEYKKVPVLQLEAIKEFEQQRQQDKESFLHSLLGSFCFVSLVFILSRLIQ